MAERVKDNTVTKKCANIDLTTNDEEESSQNVQLVFNRRPGEGGFSGQLYEIGLLILILLESRLKNDFIESFTFHLASNMEEGGVFDDAVYVNKYKSKQGVEKMQMFFLQAKHKCSRKEKINLEGLISDAKKGDFLLKKYFAAFREIKNYFCSKEGNHPVFSSAFKNSEFIIYTNAHLDYVESEKNISKVTVDRENILYIEETKFFYKVHLDGSKRDKIINVLENSSECKRLAKELADALLSDKGIEIVRGDLKFYRASLLSEVIAIEDDGRCKLRLSFLYNDDCQLTKSFIDQIKNVKKYQDKSIDDIKIELSKTVVKFSNKVSSEENAKDAQPNLPSDLVKLEEIDEFLDMLQLFTGQPNEEMLCETIKQRIQSKFCLQKADASFVFADVKTKVENWWKEGSHFLTERNTIFQDSVKMSIKFNVRKPAELFTGRSDELEELHTSIQRGSDGLTVISQMTSISGLGGIGKTELARKYVNKYEEYYDGNIIWINAESHQSLNESFRILAKERLRINTNNVDGIEKDLKSVLEDIYKFFMRRKSLFVFDNVEQYDIIKTFLPIQSLPPEANKPHIVMTSRNQEWVKGIKVLKLGILELKDAIVFVKKGLNIPLEDLAQDSEIEALVTKLQCFPLAIQQAIAYIVDQKESGEFGINKYLEEFIKQTAHLLNTKEFRGIDNGYSKTTFTTWKITIAKIKTLSFGPLAVKILNVIAYYAPERINRDLFMQLSSNEDFNLKSAVRLLVKYSMLNSEEKQSVLYVHRLVQEVARLELEAQGEDESVIRTSLYLVDKNMGKKNVDHAVSAWKYAKKYTELLREFRKISVEIVKILDEAVRLEEAYLFGDSALETLNEILNPNDLDIFALKHSIAGVLESQGKFKQAHDEYVFVESKLSTILDKDHPNILTVQHNIAKMLASLGKFNEALQEYEKILERKTCALGPIDEDTLKTKHSMAEVLGILGKYDEALKIQNEVLNLQYNSLDKEHPSILKTKNNIAVILENQGKIDLALNAYEEIIEIKSTVLGPRDLSTLTTKHNSAGLLETMGRFEEAMTRYNEVLNVRTKLLGINHRDTLATQNNIALVLNSQGKFEEALNIYHDILENMSTTLGSDHPDSLTTRNNKGVILERLGEYDEALIIYNYVLDQRLYVLGKEHPDTLLTKNNIAVVLESQGKHNEALEQLQEIVDIKVKVLGEKHLSTLITMNNLAGTLESLGRYEESLKMYKYVLGERTRQLGENNPDTLTTKNNKAFVLCRMGKFEEALIIYEEVLDKQLHSPVGSKHVDTITTKNNIAGVLKCLGKYEEALALYKEALAEKSKILPELHPQNLNAINSIADVLKLQGKYKEALQMYEELYSKRLKALGETNLDTLSTLQNIARLHKELGNYRESLDVYKGILKIKKNENACDNLDTLSLKNGIANVLKSQGNYRDALELFKEVHSKICDILEDSDEVALLIKHNIGTVLEQLGYLDDALITYIEVYHIRSVTLGPANPDTLETKKCIKRIQEYI